VPSEWGRCSGKAGGKTGARIVRRRGAVTCSFRGTPVSLGVRVCPLDSVRLFRTRRTTLTRVFVLSLRPVVTTRQSYERDFWSVNQKANVPLLSSLCSNELNAGDTTCHRVTGRFVAT
jgi:hypothetical protein